MGLRQPASVHYRVMSYMYHNRRQLHPLVQNVGMKALTTRLVSATVARTFSLDCEAWGQATVAALVSNVYHLIIRQGQLADRN